MRGPARLSKLEQRHVRAMLRYLRARTGAWKPLADALGMECETLCGASTGRRAVSVQVAFKVARFAGVSIDALLAGKATPENVCPYCGRLISDD